MKQRKRKENIGRIFLNISGSRFEISKKILLAHPDTRLGKIAISGCKGLHFDRPVASFESILSFYQTGKLHFPPNVCPVAFKEEMGFWEIGEDNLDKCCLFSFIQFMDKYKSRIEFLDEQNVDCSIAEALSRRQRIWNVIDFHEKTWVSKISLLIGLLFVLTSVTTVAIGSLPRFRRPPTACEWSEYISDATETNLEIKELFEKHYCDNIVSVQSKDMLYNIFMFYDDDDYFLQDHDYFLEDDDVQDTFVDRSGNKSRLNSTFNGNIPEKIETSFPIVTFKTDVFLEIDYASTAFFTLELIIRLLVCPSLINYFKNLVNILDSLILLGTYIDIAIVHLNKVYKFSSNLMNVVDVIKFLRIIRILRYCQHLNMVRVLKFSIKHNAKDLFVLFLHITLVVMVFANIFYISENKENIDSIPQGWWLGFVTMTTVGFGDFTPKSVPGKIACCMCALCGILTLGTITPIFVETFTSVYGIAKIRKCKRKKKVEKLNMNTEKNQSVFNVNCP